MIPRIALALILIAIDAYAFQGIQTALGSYPFFMAIKAIYWGFTAVVIGGI